MERKIENKQGSTGYLDALRVAATAAVILLHVVSGTITECSDDMSDTLVTVYTIILRICSFSVPVFLMISGALFMEKKEEIPLKELFGKYILRLFLALVIFGTAFNVLELAFLTKSFSAGYIPRGFVQMINGETWGHLWYLYMLIGIYLFMPMWQGIAKCLSREQYRYLLIVLFLVACILPLFQDRGMLKGLQFPIYSVYVLYFLSGYYMHHYLRNDGRLVPAAWVLLAAFPVLTIIDTIKGWDLTDGYNGVPLALGAASMFYLASHAESTPAWCRNFRSLTFGIYLVHTIFLNLAFKFLGVTPAAWGGIVLIPVFWVDAAFLSWLTVVILRKIPPVKRFLL